MNKITKIVIVIILTLVVGAVIALKENNSANSGSKVPENPVEKATSGEIRKALPRLVDLGAGKCIPCKMMAPILEDLKKEYAGVFNVEFIDVWENPGAGKSYGIKIIPTQVFFDAAGKEMFRHEGFFSREDILAKWQELGIDIEKKQE